MGHNSKGEGSMKIILIADDDIYLQKVIASVIEQSGHLPLFSSSGVRALHLLEDNPSIDLLITDVVMPEMTGKELVRILRSREQFLALPIIIISAIVKIDDAKELLDLGATYFLGKPLNHDHLMDYINKALTFDEA